MDTSLQSESKRLDDTLKELYNITYSDIQTINAKIEELNELLQMKEMSTDRSENASFQLAKDNRDIAVANRGRLQKRLAALEAGMGSYTPTGYITLGSTVEFSVLPIDNGANVQPVKMIFKLVVHELCQAKLGFTAVDGKVGSAFLGKRAGDIVDVVTIKGNVKYKIERVY